MDQRRLSVRSPVPVTVAESRASSQVSPANRIINSLSKEITPSRVKRGELWREHVLMSFMTLQIMHYRQEQSWGSKRNCIDFSLMATNNDIFLYPGKGQEWVVLPKGTHTQSHTHTHTQAPTRAHTLFLRMPFKTYQAHTTHSDARMHLPAYTLKLSSHSSPLPSSPDTVSVPTAMHPERGHLNLVVAHADQNADSLLHPPPPFSFSPEVSV